LFDANATSGESLTACCDCENRAIDVWMRSFSFAGKVAPHAARIEAWGFDGMLLADSQNLNADIWVELGLAAAATDRIRLGPGVTNPATRLPAVTASAVATLQQESGGRAVLGLGRGDSALLQIGRRPVHVSELGIERLIVVPGSVDADPAAVEEANARFAEDVLPAALRS
jgi:alkanesulfonate monooxygenase SsuD/methylene tetrahydromethanopterin reductase-like flavin-dependent oxidoreductase (luciferase family)